MERAHQTDFTQKHAGGKKINPAIEHEIKLRGKNNEIPCAVAFEIAEALHVDPGEIGVCLDLLNIRLTKCQLGLFGHKPRKKIVSPLDSVDHDVLNAIQSEAKGGRMPCEKAWAIASRLDLGKIMVGRACETLKIKIKPCQLGAF